MYLQSKHISGSLGDVFSQSFHQWGRKDKESDSTTYQDKIPRISLTQQHSWSLMSRRYSSTSTTNEPTLRERMEVQRDRGREAATKGAHSLREMVQKYGTVFIGTYATVYFSTLALLFTGIESGVLDPLYIMSWVSEEADAKSTVQVVTEFMDHYSWTRPYVPIVENNPEVANLGVAWIAVKFTEPIRFGVTVAIVPRLARYLGYAPSKDAPESGSTMIETSSKDHPENTSQSLNSDETKSTRN